MKQPDESEQQNNSKLIHMLDELSLALDVIVDSNKSDSDGGKNASLLAINSGTIDAVDRLSSLIGVLDIDFNSNRNPPRGSNDNDALKILIIHITISLLLSESILSGINESNSNQLAFTYKQQLAVIARRIKRTEMKTKETAA